MWGILKAQMLLPNTIIAAPDWAAAQNPADWLTPTEREVWESFPSPKRRAEWLAGRLAVKRLLAEMYGTDPLTCQVAREGVAPVVRGECPPGLSLSLSHSGGLGAASLCAAAEGTVGVDVQRIRPVHRGLAARVFSAEERAQAGEQPDGLLLLWALKEAAIKARRLPWGRALREMEVRLIGPGQAEIAVPGEAAQTAAYAFVEGGWWLARSIRPLEALFQEALFQEAGPDATA